jgi:hypothetical protein
MPFIQKKNTHLGQWLDIFDHPGCCWLSSGSEGLVLQVVVLLLPPAPRQLLHGRLLVLVLVMVR